MKLLSRSFGTFILLSAIVLLTSMCANKEKSKEYEVKTDVTARTVKGAFQDYRDSVPSKEEYSGSLFKLSHDYPTTVTPVVDPSWQQVLNGQPISASNTFAYMEALKSYIEPRVMPFFTNNKAWTSAEYGWFNEPWMGSQREAILGTYLGNGNQANMFESLKVDEAGYALVLYDSIAAYTVGKIWGKTGEKVNLANDAAQFTEGSVVVKFAFSNINYPEWPVMEGAQTFSIYDTIPTGKNPKKGYDVRTVSFFQMDVIVKDSKTAPKTGWVFSTFVYDQNVERSIWDKMVPLGAMWGDDPDVNSPVSPPYPELSETVINPDAPAYSTETLGWGGRLSGPNDGAVALNITDVKGNIYDRLPLSSCMSCHSPAQDKFVAFLLPMNPKNGHKAYFPGSDEWNLYFRDDYGDVPFTKGETAMDYDMVMAMKSLTQYNLANPTSLTKAHTENLEAIQKYRRINTRSRFWH